MRFAPSPSQNTGIEIPMSARIISSGSQIDPFSTTAASPVAIASTTQMIAAPMTSENVIGAAAVIAGTTLSAWLPYETRSRETKSRFIISTYCAGFERSRPNWWRTAATVSGVGLRPASERVGSTPGVAKKIRNVSTVIANSTRTRLIRRRTTKTSTRRLALQPQLRPRVERVAHAVPEHVEGQDGEHDHDPRPDRQ